MCRLVGFYLTLERYPFSAAIVLTKEGSRLLLTGKTLSLSEEMRLGQRERGPGFAH